MRFRLGLATGLATGYYLGARAGRQRYDQINRTMAKLRRTKAFQSVVDDAKSAVEDAADKAKAVVEEGVDKARSAVHLGGHDNGSTTPSGITGPPMGPGGYSSSR
jgi:hypothetical protein